MNLYALQKITSLFCAGEEISRIFRIDDNLIKIHLRAQVLYVNLQKSQSSIFCAHEELLARKNYNAPFDLALQKYCANSEICGSKVDGNNRILHIFLRKKLHYKTLECVLVLEFTGKYTNAIICLRDFIVLEALHKITNNLREVKVGAPLKPLEQQKIAPKKIEIQSIDEFLFAQYDEFMAKNLESAKASALAALNKKRERLISRARELENKNALLKKAEYYAHIGDLLKINTNLAFISNPLKLIDYNGAPCEFRLDFEINSKTPGALMNELFTKSKKLHAKAQNIDIQKENLRASYEFLDSKIDFVRNARTISDVKMIYQKQQQRKKLATKPKFESFFIGDVKISIGKNKLENIELLKSARANDMWLHVRGIPSSHVIIHASKNKISEAILQKAGEIAVSFLRAKNGNFLVDYTQRKFVKVKEGANVVYANYGTMTFKK